MIASEARISANRANAQKSTGPKTSEGKERSRGNAVKHGMTGAGIALPQEDVEEVERRIAGFEADYRPTTESGTALVRRAAMLSVRLERCAAREAAAIARNVRAAEADFDEARAAEVEELFGKLATDAGAATRRLMRMPEGIDRLVAAWRELREDLLRGKARKWGLEHGAMTSRLLGRKPSGFGVDRIEAMTRATWGNFSLLDDSDGAGLGEMDRRAWACRELLGVIDGAIADLEARRARIDLDAIAADRAGAATLALFDPSKEATLARKYEAAAEREMHRALKEMKAVEAEAAKREKSAPPLASFSPGAPSPPAEASPMPAATPSASRFPAEEASTLVPITIGRADQGSR